MKKKNAFTLIELMIVVAIIGILAAIAIPKFSALVDKSKEGATKGALASIRTALSVYYSDNEGVFPSDNLSILTSNGKYLTDVPFAKLPGTGHQNSNAVAAAANAAGLVTDAGGWAYLNNPADHEWGRLAVNCQHSDSGAATWSTF